MRLLDGFPGSQEPCNIGLNEFNFQQPQIITSMINQESSAVYHRPPKENNQALEHRVTELDELLNFSRKLSNILNLHELYALLSEIVRRKIGADMFSIFIYRQKPKIFRLVSGVSMHA